MKTPRADTPRRGARLGPRERLRRGREYRQVYDKARALHGRTCVVFVHTAEGLERRAGFVAGRKVGNAVRRNRARRLLREAYRRLKSSLPSSGVQMVFVAKAPCAMESLAGIDCEMRKLLVRAGVLS